MHNNNYNPKKYILLNGLEQDIGVIRNQLKWKKLNKNDNWLNNVYDSTIPFDNHFVMLLFLLQIHIILVIYIYFKYG